MSLPSRIVLAGPPGEGFDLLQSALLGNTDVLRDLGIDVAQRGEIGQSQASVHIFILVAPAQTRLAALGAKLDRPVKAIVYVEPPHATLLARTERALLAGRPLGRQLLHPKPLGYQEMLAPFELAFGAGNVAYRIASPAQSPGAAIVEDFWRIGGLPGDHASLDLSRLRPARRLSLEAALTLDRLLAQYAKHMDPKRNRPVSSVAMKLVGRLAGRPFSLPRDHVEAVMEASREDIEWLADRVGPDALAEPRPRFQEPAWAMDADTLDSIASLIVRSARQTVEHRALRQRIPQPSAQT